LVLFLLMLLLLPPPRPLASTHGQYRRDLLPNMAHDLKPLLRAHDLLLAQSARQHRQQRHLPCHRYQASLSPRTAPTVVQWFALHLLAWEHFLEEVAKSEDETLYCTIAHSHPPCLLSCRLTPIRLLKSVSAEVHKWLHNLRR